MTQIICKAVSRKLLGVEMWQFVKMQKKKGKWVGDTLGDPKAYYLSAEEACDGYRDYLEDNEMNKSPDWLDFYERKGENVKVSLGKESK